MRRREPLDPAVEAELAALDAALAGTPDADAELAALVRDVRAIRDLRFPVFHGGIAPLDSKAAANSRRSTCRSSAPACASSLAT